MGTSQVTVSMDGIRKNAALNLKRLHHRLDEFFEELEGIDGYADHVESIKDAMDDLNGSVGSFFFVYSPEMDGFSDLTDEYDKLMPARFDEED